MSELAWDAEIIRLLTEAPPEPTPEDIEHLAEAGERHAPAEHH